MREFLLFRLYGPMAAWGNIAVGEDRPSFAHPSKAAVIGLLAAALGITRNDAERQRSLAMCCYFAVRVDAAGSLLSDYHTIQSPASKPRVIYHTRRAELAADKIHTILSARDYRCEAAYTVALEIRQGGAYTARQLADALARPVFTLYLGRKCCPPAMPLKPRVVIAPSLEDALAGERIGDIALPELFSRPHTLLYWEEGMRTDLIREQVIARRDEPLSRCRWQFTERYECYCSLAKEDAACTSQ